LVKIVGDDTPLSDLDRNAIRSHLSYLHSIEAGRNSVYRKLAAIKSFIRWADNEGLRCDLRILNLSSPKRRAQLPDVPSAAEMEKYCNGEIQTACPERDRVIVELLYGSGLRNGELVAVNLSDFKYRDALLIRGKGKKERMVTVTECAQDAIQKWLPVRERLLMKSKLETDALLIRVRQENVALKEAIRKAYADGSSPSQADLSKRLGVSQPWISLLRKRGLEPEISRRPERLDVRTVGRIVKAIAKAKQLPDYHPHLLRHACGTHLHDNGVSLLGIQRLLGHSNLATTQIYTRVSTGRMLEVYRKAHPHARKVA
jgi:integrase/recombinase XerC